MSPIWTKFGGQIELDARNPILKLFSTYLIKQKSYARSNLKTHFYNAFCFLLLRIHSFQINVTHSMIRPDEHFRKHPTSPSSHVIPSSNTSSKKMTTIVYVSDLYEIWWANRTRRQQSNSEVIFDVSHQTKKLWTFKFENTLLQRVLLPVASYSFFSNQGEPQCDST